MEDATITLSADPETGYQLKKWTVTYNGGNSTVGVVENQFSMPADNVTVSATFRYVGAPQVSYQLVTSADQLEAGGSYLIVSRDYSKALGTTQNANNRSAADVDIANDVISTIGDDVCELTLGGTDGLWTFFDAGANGYLYAASSSNNYLKTQTTLDDNGRWDITVNAGTATLLAQGNNTRNNLQYNNTNTANIFSCYSTTQKAVSLFHRVETYPTEDEQTFAFNKGWNWWSTYLDISLEDLEEALDGHGTDINAQNGSTSYLEGYGWEGDPITIDPIRMYKIHTDEAIELVLNGIAIDPADHTVTLKPGRTTWIGFPESESMTLSQAFANHTPTKGDIVKGANGSATWIGNIWTGTLKKLEPGEGYAYKSKAATQKTFTFPSGK